MKIPTQKGEHSYKCTKSGLKQKEGITLVGTVKFFYKTNSYRKDKNNPDRKVV